MRKIIRCEGAWARDMKNNWENTRTGCRERTIINAHSRKTQAKAKELYKNQSTDKID